MEIKQKKKRVREVKKKTSVTLSLYYRTFIKEQIATGRFSSASDVMVFGLRLLEQEDILLEKKKKRKAVLKK